MLEVPLFVIFIIIFFLLCLSGFFSGSETGLTAVSRAKIYHLKSEGNKRAKLVSDLREDKDRLIGAILLGNNAVNILASSLATFLALQYFGDEGVAYATIAMTLLVLIFAEVLPKTYAFSNAEKVALAVSPILNIVVIVLSPITMTVQKVVESVMRATGLDNNDVEEDVSSTEVLRGAIHMHHDEGTMIKRDKDMLNSILNLEKTEVNEVMVHRKKMETIDISLPKEEIVKMVLDSRFSRIPLYEDDSDNIIGVLHVKDLVRELERFKGEIEALDISTIMMEPWFIPETTALMQQLQAFRDKQNHFALVVDEYGTLLGLITLEDILEEIVGQIEDEFDQNQPQMRKKRKNTYIIDGAVTVRDVNRALDWDLPDDVATTIAGFLISKAQQIPSVGQIFKFDGYRFEVTKKHRNQIMSMLVQQLPKEDTQS